MPLERGVVRATTLAEPALKNVSLWAERKQVRLVSQCDAGDLRVIADQSLTMRVLTNLLSNAIQASSAGTTVTVRMASHNNDVVAFCVMDQGAGIPKEWANRVFDKFGQVEAREAGGAVGYGLGLTFCRNAVQAQGVSISLASETGRGTTVTFAFPAAR